MITNGIYFKNFKYKKNAYKIVSILKEILKKKDSTLQSLSKNFKESYNKKILRKFSTSKNFRIIGMGGSILGAEAIYSFLKDKIKKNFVFINDLDESIKSKKNQKYSNLVVSKSGETIETIVNFNLLSKKTDKNLFITENRKSYLYEIAEKLKAEIVHHHNFIGGRYSVLSETGMLPAELMGLNSKKFRQLNTLINNKKYMKSLVANVESILFFINKKKYNSIILNYDKKSEGLFYWYQQLVAESLGKNRKGLFPIVSNMPKDNHSLMQLYLEGFNNNFFTFFYVNEKSSSKIINNKILSKRKYLKNKKLTDIIFAQKKATENIFNNRNIPFRSFEIKKRNEKTLGELFCFFILETILLGKAMKINPYNQPAVELIKDETKKILS